MAIEKGWLDDIQTYYTSLRFSDMNKTGLVQLIDCLIEKLNRIAYFLFSMASPIECKSSGFSICLSSVSVVLLMLLVLFYSWIIQTILLLCPNLYQIIVLTLVFDVLAYVGEIVQRHF